MPPSVAFAPGSSGKNSPSARSSSFSRSRVTPASTRQSKSPWLTDRMRSIRVMSIETPPARASTCPSRELPAPKGITGTPCAWQAARMAETSSVLSGQATRSGG